MCIFSGCLDRQSVSTFSSHICHVFNVAAAAHWARIIKKHLIALLGCFVSKKRPNRGIKCQFDIVEKIQRGDPSMSKKFSSLFPLKFHVSFLKGISILDAKFEQNHKQKNF